MRSTANSEPQHVARSATFAVEALFTGHADAIDAFVAVCRPVEGQVGALFVVSGRVASLDLFDSEATLRRILPKLVRSCAVDAIDTGADAASRGIPEGAAAARFLEAVAAAPHHVTKARGLGDDVRISGAGLIGAALVVDGRAVHVSAFIQ